MPNATSEAVGMEIRTRQFVSRFDDGGEELFFVEGFDLRGGGEEGGVGEGAAGEVVAGGCVRWVFGSKFRGRMRGWDQRWEDRQ